MSKEVRNWKILYNEFKGMEKQAVRLLNREVGRLINRDVGVYWFHVLPCITDEKDIDGNVIAVGTYENSAFIRKFIKRDEVPKNGYLVKVFDNPENNDLKIALIVGDTDKEIFYGAVEFVDDFFAAAAYQRQHLTYSEKIFYGKLPDYCHASSPKIKTRSIFTWGQPMNDYRAYIDNMARLRMNQLIIWNDYVPLNSDEVVDYAHEYGIEVLWGYAWGWKRDCNDAEIENLEKLEEEIIKEYKENYSHIKGDGIYFQSFTELYQEKLNGMLIADAVTKLVNNVSGKLLEMYPGLHLQFGLHAQSVTDKLEYIKKVDKRVEIVWEDCGAFPFSYRYYKEDDFGKTCEFIKEILTHRENAPVGMYYKAQLINDWRDWEFGGFEHQGGRYVLGEDSPEIVKADADVINPIWKFYQHDWLEHGKLAHEMTNMILDVTKGEVNVGMAGQFSGQIWYSTALCAELLWDPTDDFESISRRVMKRHNVHLD